MLTNAVADLQCASYYPSNIKNNTCISEAYNNNIIIIIISGDALNTNIYKTQNSQLFVTGALYCRHHRLLVSSLYELIQPVQLLAMLTHNSAHYISDGHHAHHPTFIDHRNVPDAIICQFTVQHLYTKPFTR